MALKLTGTGSYRIELVLYRAVDVFTWLETTFGDRLIVLDTEKFVEHGIEWPSYSLDHATFSDWVTSRIESIGIFLIQWKI